MCVGTLEQFLGTWQIVHPDQILFPSAAQNWQEKQPIYPLTAGLFQSQIQKLVCLALQRLPDLPEWHPPHCHPELVSGPHDNEIPNRVRDDNELSWKTALQKVHTPQQAEDLDPSTLPGRGLHLMSYLRIN